MTNPYLLSERIRAALRGLDVHPTRGMGQNFLRDPEALANIVNAADLSPDDVVVEVGPGLGVLTWELLRRVRHVVVVELDKRLAARLHDEFATATNLTIIQSDILRIEPSAILASLAQDGQLPAYKVVANLPYAITSPVLRHFLEGDWKPSSMVLLVQREVAQRIAAKAGSLSVLAHSVQIYGKPEIVAMVPPTSFIPAPAVTSAVLRITLYPQPVVDVDNIDNMFRIIKAGFLQARKKLSNALPTGLAAMGRRIERDAALKALEDAGISPDRRAETVTIDEWATLYRILQAES